MANNKNKKKIRFVNIVPYIYIAPMIIALLLFSGWPFISGVITSFYRSDGLNVHDFIWLDNYKNILFHDKVFWHSLKVLFYFFIGMNVCFCAPIIAAKFTYSLFSEKMKFFVRSAFTITNVVPSVVLLMVWKFIYYPNIGLVARVCEQFGMDGLNLLGNPSTAVFAVIMIGFPWVTGLSYLMYFASLQAVDTSMIEAAKIDGANAWQIFKKVELPAIKPIIISLYLLAFINQFHNYERMLILTNGGPDKATLIPGLYMYQKAFGGSESEFGYACALAMILFVISFVLSRLFRNKGEA